jgi:purine-binding chemotaxis protein CheW
MSTETSTHAGAAGGDLNQYVTVWIGDQLFGLPISRVQDVFMPDRVTRVPLASAEIEGVLNLRGRIVTAVNMDSSGRKPMAVGTELNGEAYGLLIDSVGEVLNLDDHSREPNPINLDQRLQEVSAGVHRLAGQLLVVLDVDRVLDLNAEAMA